MAQTEAPCAGNVISFSMTDTHPCRRITPDKVRLLAIYQSMTPGQQRAVLIAFEILNAQLFDEE